MPLDLQKAVRDTADLIATQPTISDDDLAMELEHMGWASDLADRLGVFVPLAFGRVFLAADPPQFSDEYKILDEDSKRSAWAELSNEPIYVLATELAQVWQRSGDLEKLEAVASRSAETQAVQQLLAEGGRPSDIALTEPIVFGLVPPTTGRPWWKFW